jgi:peptidoglycan/xylan/chitin deacetylase (PgdA/CDA1 family)
MRIPVYPTTRRRINATLIVTGVLIAAAITVLVMTAVRGPQPGHDNPEPAAGLASPGQSPALSQDSIRPRPFRFPEEQQNPGNHDREWRMLDANNPGDNSRESITGFLQHRMLHFTFDDGPLAATTPKLLDMLSAYNVRATFFVVGKYLFGPNAQVHGDLLRRTGKEGHTVAIHSYTHKDFRHLSAAQINRELYRSGRLLETILGYHPGLFRPPYGGRNLRTNSLLHVRGYTEILWNIAPEEYGARTPQEILGNFQAALDRQEQHNHGPGGIVLLHDNRARTVQAFPLIMEELRRRNCALVQQDGQELWDVAGDLSYFLFYGDQLPGDLVARRQVLARTAATRYCVERGRGKDQVMTEQHYREYAG